MVTGKIKIAVDAMGGDFAPQEIVKGAYLAAEAKSDIGIFLVGKPALIEEELTNYSPLSSVGITKALETFEMGEYSPWELKKKSDTSIMVGLDLVKKREAHAFVSAGDTGAVMSTALLALGRIKGVLRPAIAVVIPTPQKPVVLLDAGANAETKPLNMLQFAKMGWGYAHKVLEVENPSVGLLNIGTEKKKGNVLIQTTHKLLEREKLNFIGNVEGKDITQGTTDVVVCDGFTGNVVLKAMEGAAEMVFSEVMEASQGSTRGKLGGFFLLPSFKTLYKRYSQEEYGGAHLLGVNGVTIVGHGGSKATAVKNAILVAARTVRRKIVDELESLL